MCYAAPGPRCGPHAKDQLGKSQAKLVALEEEHARLGSEIRQALSDSSYASEEEVETLRTRQQELYDDVDRQRDRVSSDRDAYRATSNGVKQLRKELEDAFATKNRRKIAELQTRYHKAAQEYQDRMLAHRVAQRDKKNLEANYRGGSASEIIKNLDTEYSQLKAREAVRNRDLAMAQQAVHQHPQSQSARQAFMTARQAADAAKRARMQFEHTQDCMRAGVSKLSAVAQAKDHDYSTGEHYLRLRPADFGVAHEYFPRGSLVRIDSVEHDEVGNMVAKLETGDRHIVYSDTKVYASAA